MADSPRGRIALKARLIVAVAAVVIAAGLIGSGAAADTLHLDSGGTIEVTSWRIEGTNLIYTNAAGTVGIPRSMVTNITPSEAVPDGADKPKAARQPKRPTPKGPAKSANKIRAQYDDAMETAEAFLAENDLENASLLFHQAIMLEPNSYAARVQFAFCEIRLNQDASALNAVLDGLVLHPKGAELHELLGDLRDREERLDDAIQSWKRAQSLKASERVETKIAKAQRDLASRRDYNFARTTHFNIRYDGDVDAALANDVSAHLEEEYWRLSKHFDHAPLQPITTLLYPNEAFRDVTQAADWVGGLFDGKIRVPLGGVSRLHPGARRVLTHELAHAFIHSKSHGRAPRWLHEGLAQQLEGRRLSDESDQEVAAALSKIDQPDQWEAEGFSYPIALSLTSWLEARRDASHVIWLLELLSEGLTVDQALRRAYGGDYASLTREWSASARQRGAAS